MVLWWWVETCNIDCMSFWLVLGPKQSATWPNPSLSISLHPLKPPLGMECGFNYYTPSIIFKGLSCLIFPGLLLFAFTNRTPLTLAKHCKALVAMHSHLLDLQEDSGAHE